jgi:hypothetical protein
MKRIIDQLFNSSEKRLADFSLLISARKAGADFGNYSQETLAEMIGTTRSRVACL